MHAIVASPILMHFSTTMLVPCIVANNLMYFDSWRQTQISAEYVQIHIT